MFGALWEFNSRIFMREMLIVLHLPASKNPNKIFLLVDFLVSYCQMHLLCSKMHMVGEVFTLKTLRKKQDIFTHHCE